MDPLYLLQLRLQELTTRFCMQSRDANEDIQSLVPFRVSTCPSCISDSLQSCFELVAGASLVLRFCCTSELMLRSSPKVVASCFTYSGLAGYCLALNNTYIRHLCVKLLRNKIFLTLKSKVIMLNRRP